MEDSSHYPRLSVDDLEPLQPRYFVVPGALWAAVLVGALYVGEAPGHSASPAHVGDQVTVIAAA